MSSSPEANPPAGPVSRLIESGEVASGRILAALRPRVSLASGSIMVLLTLILPIGYESCGPETRGYELLQGRGGWPTLLGISFGKYFGSPFYGVLLALALVTLVLVVISLFKPSLWHNRALCRRLFLLSGALSLFLLADVTALLPMGADEWGSVAVALIIASCLAPIAFWPRRVLEIWLGLIGILLLTAWLSTKSNLKGGDISSWFMVGTWFVYGLGPIILWLGMISGRFGDQRQRIRRGLIVFYFLVALGNVAFFEVAWREGIEGFVPCSLGLYLMALGYTRLAKEGAPAATAPLSGGTSAP